MSTRVARAAKVFEHLLALVVGSAFLTVCFGLLAGFIYLCNVVNPLWLLVTMILGGGYAVGREILS